MIVFFLILAFFIFLLYVISAFGGTVPKAGIALLVVYVIAFFKFKKKKSKTKSAIYAGMLIAIPVFLYAKLNKNANK